MIICCAVVFVCFVVTRLVISQDNDMEWISAAIWMTFAFVSGLSGMGNFCVGCWMFNQLLAFGLVPSNVAIQCGTSAY